MLLLEAALVVKSSSLLKTAIFLNKGLRAVDFTWLGHRVEHIVVVMSSVFSSYRRVNSRDVPLVSAASARAAPFVEFSGHAASIVWTLRLRQDAIRVPDVEGGEDLEPALLARLRA